MGRYREIAFGMLAGLGLWLMDALLQASGRDHFGFDTIANEMILEPPAAITAAYFAADHLGSLGLQPLEKPGARAPDARSSDDAQISSASNRQSIAAHSWSLVQSRVTGRLAGQPRIRRDDERNSVQRAEA